MIIPDDFSTISTSAKPTITEKLMKLPKFKYICVDDYVLEKVRGKSVLHLGCVGNVLKKGSESCVHLKISEVADVLWGIDIDPSGLDQLKAWLPEDGDRIRYFFANAESLQDLQIDRKFEVIFVGSIIEHLSNPGLMLGGLRDLLSPEGVIIIVTPNSSGLSNFLKVALRRKESINAQHSYWFSVAVLTELCSRYDLVPVEWNTGYGYRKPSLKVALERSSGIALFKLFPQLGGNLIGVFKLKQS